jgi:hypothetical protein
VAGHAERATRPAGGCEEINCHRGDRPPAAGVCAKRGMDPRVDTIGSGRAATAHRVDRGARSAPGSTRSARAGQLRPVMSIEQDDRGDRPLAAAVCAKRGMDPRVDTIGFGRPATARHVDRGARSAPRVDTIGFGRPATARHVDRGARSAPRVDTIGFGRPATARHVDRGARYVPHAGVAPAGCSAELRSARGRCGAGTCVLRGGDARRG